MPTLPTLAIRVVVASLLVAGGADAAGPLVVTTTSLGPEGGAMKAADVSAAIGEDAAVAGKSATSWRDPPRDIGQAGWASVVTAGFGDQAHAYAFVRGAGGGTFERVVHVPYRMTVIHNARQWIPPVGRLAWSIARPEAQATADSRPAVRIDVVAAAVTASTDLLEADGPGGDDALHAAGATRGLAAVEAMAWAAAFEAGWRPTSAADAMPARLQVRFGAKSCSFELAVGPQTGPRRLVKNGVTETAYHDVLVRMFRCLHPGGAARDFIRVGGAGSAAVAVLPGRLLAVSEGALFGLDTETFRIAWPKEGKPTSAAQRTGDAIAVRDDGQGGSRVFRHRPTLAAIDVATGAATPLATGGADHPWSFDVSGTRAVVASGTSLILHEGGRKAWQHDEPVAISCGPVIVDDMVVAGAEDGELFSLSITDGKPRWRAILEPGLRGAAVVAEGRIFVFVRGADAVIAVDATTGKSVWRESVGDVLVRPPHAGPTGLIVATKSNRLLVLEPATGRIRAERRFPTWIADVITVPGGGTGLVACLLRDGRIVFLGRDDLRVVAERAIGSRGRGPLLFAASFPRTWPGAAGDEDDLAAAIDAEARAACLLVGDEDGSCFMLPIPEAR